MDAGEPRSNPIETNTSRKERRKPLRTYGKRASTERETLPSAKRRKATPGGSAENRTDAREVSQCRDVETERSVVGHEGTATVESLPPIQPTIPKKATILSYFKPTAAPSSAPISDDVSPDVEDNPTPPSSPPPPEVRRVPRRLTTRPAIAGDSGLSVDSRGSSPSISPSKDSGGDKKKAAAKKAVQTTLNLSLKGELTECRVCSMLYNSVHPKDVKLHARRHAATLKQRQLQQGVEQDE